MISFALTLLTAGVLIYVIVVAVRVCTAWFARGERDRTAIRSAGLRVITGSIGRSTAREWRDAAWSRCKALAAWARARRDRDGAAQVAVPPPAAAQPPPPPQRIPAPQAPPHLDDLNGAAVPAQGAPVPPDWAAVCARITAFEPEDDADMLAFMRSEAAAFPALSDAWRAVADTQLHVIGIDPAAVSGTIELADVLGDCAHDVVMAVRKFLVTYAEIQAAIAGGLILPHNARQFLTGAGS